MTISSDWPIYLSIFAGVIVSLLMPIIRDLAKIKPPTERGIAWLRLHFWPTARPYFYMAIFSLLTAIVILAGVKVKHLSIDSNWGAFLLGYFADATVQKLKP